MRRLLPPPRLLVTLAIVVVLGLAAAVVVNETSREGVAGHLQSSRDISVPGDDMSSADDGDAVPMGPGAIRYTDEGAVFGPAEGKKTLVLYDVGGPQPAESEMHALNAAMLATHFGQVTALPVTQYKAGMLERFDAALYVGSVEGERIEPAFIRDMTSSSKPVIWTYANIDQLTGADGVPTAAFVERYGWDPSRSVVNPDERPIAVRYKGQDVQRNAVDNKTGVVVPRITDPGAVEVVADAVCGDAEGTAPCRAEGVAGKPTTPWAIRSANLTYVTENPFIWTSENDRVIVYGDLLYDALDPERTREEVRQAAVRLEDVSPVSNPDHIRNYADYLHSEGVPFQITVIPRYMDPHGVDNEGRPTSVTLQQAPQVVAALKYAQTKGATLVQHGTTHQFQELDNPYNGLSGADFEFFRSVCIDDPNPPFEEVPCRVDNYVRNTGPLPDESVNAWKTRIEHGRQLFVEAGLDAPPLFETPHYVASNKAYQAMSLVYPTRYERVEYGNGLLSNQPQTMSIGMVFPYRVTDPFGNTILPENLGNYAPESFSGHDPKPPEFLISNAEANLVVRESTASFFYHPYLPIEELQKTVRGIKKHGYTFVPATELR